MWWNRKYLPRKNFCCLLRYSDWWRKSACVFVWVASWTSCIFHGTPFFFFFFLSEYSWQTVAFQTSVFGRLLLEKWMKSTHHFKENNTQYLLPMITWAFKQKLEFQNIISTTTSLSASILRCFSIEISGDMNKWDFLYFIMKSANIRKICVTQ